MAVFKVEVNSVHSALVLVDSSTPRKKERGVVVEVVVATRAVVVA